MAQFVEPLKKHGIELEISPFLDAKQFGEFYKGSGILTKASGTLGPVLKRIGQLGTVGKYDLIFVQREAMFFGPALFEWLYKSTSGAPVVLDLDDATYIRYVSPRYGKTGSLLKFFGKTDNLIKRSAAVMCGNRFIAEYVESKVAKAAVIPTVVDTDKFQPVEKINDTPVLGWIGTHSTFPFLQTLFPVLEELAEIHRFVLKIVGAGKKNIKVKGVEVRNLDWELNREIEDFQTLDIGLYPMTVTDSANRQWLQGKSGFKAIQYMAVGVPFVMSPVGVGGEIGMPGETHFNAEADEDWYNSLNKLLSDADLRTQMGRNAREHSIENYTVAEQAGKMAAVFDEAVRK